MKIRLGSSAYGQGVFATERIAEGEKILEFAGPLLRREQLPACCERTADRYLQIGEDMYLGASGALDDYVNHSCSPNSGLVYHSNGVTLVALRVIQAGEELNFDYSTSMDEEEWTMECGCGSPICRGIVEDFVTLPLDRQQYYIKRGVVPQFILLSITRRAVERKRESSFG